MTSAYDVGTIPEFDLGDRIRKALSVAGIGVGEIADYLGVTRQTVGSWINGRNGPSKAAVRLVALRTGVPFHWLETGEAPPSGGDGGASEVRPEGFEPPTSWLGALPHVTSSFAHRGLRVAGHDVTPIPHHKVA